MIRAELNDRSPMRVFEHSIHGGLGRGRVGVVVSRAGLGKTALLVQIALDDLLRERRVLHISHEHPVDRVRSYYDGLFTAIVEESGLEQPGLVHVEMERRRLIYSHLGHATSAPPSLRGGQSSIGKITETLAFARDVAHFAPDVVIIDGFDFEHASADALVDLRKLAAELDAELWLSAKTRDADTAPPSSYGPASTPAPLRRFYEDIDVIVSLAPERDCVRLRVLKDHDATDTKDLELRLDPQSMRILDADVPDPREGPRDPRRFHLYSGGARGAEAAFGELAERWGLEETHYSFAGHERVSRQRGLVVLDDDALARGDFSLVFASHRLARPLGSIPGVRPILQTIWHQIQAARQVFVVGAVQPDGTVRGGTGWGAELAKLWHKPLFVFDQAQDKWLRWDGHAFKPPETEPCITERAFAGIGTQTLTEAGRAALEQLFRRSFGEPSG
jgi:hypothetical protein